MGCHLGLISRLTSFTNIDNELIGDILETKWKPGGPQISLANDEGNTYWNKTEAQNIQMGVWDSIGGAPNPKFATYGALIRDNNLWIYAYKPDGTIWYSTDSIPNTNTEKTKT